MLSDLREEKENSDSENVYLRQILSWESAREPQLGMMIRQFKKEDGFSVGYKYSQADFESVLDKVLEWSKLTPEQRFPKTHNTKGFKPDQPKDGIFQEPPKKPPKKLVWIPSLKSFRTALTPFRGPPRPNPRLNPRPPNLSLHHKLQSLSLSLSLSLRPLCVTTVTIRVTLRSFASEGSERRGWRSLGGTRTSSTRRVVDLSFLGAWSGQTAGRVV